MRVHLRSDFVSDIVEKVGAKPHHEQPRTKHVKLESFHGPHVSGNNKLKTGLAKLRRTLSHEIHNEDANENEDDHEKEAAVRSASSTAEKPAWMSPVLAQSLQRIPLNGNTGSLRQVWKTRLFLTALPVQGRVFPVWHTRHVMCTRVCNEGASCGHRR
jgi:hypothetical protein